MIQPSNNHLFHVLANSVLLNDNSWKVTPPVDKKLASFLGVQDYNFSLV